MRRAIYPGHAEICRSRGKGAGDRENLAEPVRCAGSFHYNTGSISTATLTRLHKAEKFAEAQVQFGKWIYNDGKPMKGLKNRRADEAKLYGAP